MGLGRLSHNNLHLSNDHNMLECKGIGSTPYFLQPPNLIQKYRKNLLFLMETKVSVDKGRTLGAKWGYPYCMGISCMGRSGGLLLLWDSLVHVNIISSNRNGFNSYVEDCSNGFGASFVYGHPQLNHGDYL